MSEKLEALERRQRELMVRANRERKAFAEHFEAWE